MVRKSPASFSPTISPVSSMMPVNICSNEEIWPARTCRPVYEWDRLGQFLNAFAADGGNFTSTEDRGRDKDHHLINYSCTKRIKSQVGPAFQEEALDFAFVQLIRKSCKSPTKKKSVRECENPAPPIENNAK